MGRMLKFLIFLVRSCKLIEKKKEQQQQQQQKKQNKKKQKITKTVNNFFVKIVI